MALGKLLVAAAVAVGGYEGWKWWQKGHAKIAMQKGHLYSLALDYTKDPPSPVTTAQVQAILDAASPGTFDVVTAAMTPGAQSGIRQMAIQVVMTGPTEDVPSSMFTSGWPSSFGTVTLASSQDMGGAPSAPSTVQAIDVAVASHSLATAAELDALLT